MKRKIQFILLLSLMALLSCKENNSLEGKVLIGFEEDKFFDGENENFQTVLTFKNDSVIVERNLIEKQKNNQHKKLGVQYRYKGLVKKDGTNLSFIAVQYKCNDCPPLVEVEENGKINDVLDQKEYKGYVTKNGAILNGIDFTENKHNH